MGVAGLLELKNLNQKYQVYKVNCPNGEFLCKPLYLSDGFLGIQNAAMALTSWDHINEDWKSPKI